MKFDNIKADVKKVELDIMRMDNENYFEAVIDHERLEGMIRVLEGIFGPPAWPSDKKLSKYIEGLIKDAGGLRKGQTLYFLDEEECLAFAMLWPWQDGKRITIKIAKILRR